MCLTVSRLFWVSSLAYPNLLGTKGYVVVVVTQKAYYILVIGVGCLLSHETIFLFPNSESKTNSDELPAQSTKHPTENRWLRKVLY
jgi:hypothetical protein